MLDKVQLFKDVIVILFIVWVIIISICIIDIYSILNLFEVCIDILQDCADVFFEYMNNDFWVQI